MTKTFYERASFMPFLQLILINLAIVAALMTAMWVFSLLLKDASIVDPFWGSGFVVIAWSTFFFSGNEQISGSWVAWLLLATVTIWGLRLTGYLLWRNHGKGEDRRYGAMREKHGERFWWVSFLTVFLLQGLIMWFVSLTVQAGIAFAGQVTVPLWPLAVVGTLLWLIGFAFEAGGDYQMAIFKSNPDNQGKVMDRGFWRYTRHPNYFGDFTIWWGLYLIASSVGAWWTALGPALMSFLLLKVSGVSMLESDIEDRRPKYADYKRRTNAFFPGPPKS